MGAGSTSGASGGEDQQAGAAGGAAVVCGAAEVRWRRLRHGQAPVRHRRRQPERVAAPCAREQPGNAALLPLKSPARAEFV